MSEDNMVIIIEDDIKKWKSSCISGKKHLVAFSFSEDQEFMIDGEEFDAPLFNLKCIICDIQGAFNHLLPKGFNEEEAEAEDKEILKAMAEDKTKRRMLTPSVELAYEEEE